MRVDLNPLGKRAQMVAAITTTIESHALARNFRKLRQHLGRYRFLAGAIERSRNPFGIGLRLIAHGLECGDTLFQIRVAKIG